MGDVDLLPCTLSAEVFERLAVTQEAQAAVLPVENSLHGAVADHADLILRHGVCIAGELSLRIRHALIAPSGTAQSEVRRVLSHPVALSQCRRFFAANQQLEAVPFYDTAGAVKHIMTAGLTDAAAIAAPYAAEVYGGKVLSRDLEDDPLNFTRFFLLARPDELHLFRATDAPVNKMSLAFDLPHRPGSLQAALALLSDAGADLTRIESRPIPGRPWEYMFFVDLRIDSTQAADTVLRLLQPVCGSLTEFGRYAAAASDHMGAPEGVAAAFSQVLR